MKKSIYSIAGILIVGTLLITAFTAYAGQPEIKTTSVETPAQICQEAMDSIDANGGLVDRIKEARCAELLEQQKLELICDGGSKNCYTKN